MLTTKQLLAMTPQNAVAAMLNDINPGLNLNGGDVVYGTPVAVGSTLTQVPMTMRRRYSPVDFVPYTDEVLFTYNRLDIANFAALAFFDFNPELPSSTQALLDQLTSLFGTGFDPKDFVIEPITAANAGNYTLKTNPGSLRWVGQYTVALGDSTDLFINGTFPLAIVNVPFTATFVASGGVGPYVYSANGLPDGMDIDSVSGEVTGQSAVLGPFQVTIIAVDSQNTQTQIGVTLTVVKATLLHPLVEILEDFPSATVGVPYSARVPIIGGDGTFTLPTIIQGMAPPGLVYTLDGDEMCLDGTPTAPFFNLVMFSCKSGDGQVGNLLQQFVTLPPMAIVGEFMTAEYGKPFVDALAVTGGSGTYYEPILAEGSSLPDGIDTLIMNFNKLEIRGTPTNGGTFTITILTGYGQSLTVTLTLNVSGLS